MKENAGFKLNNELNRLERFPSFLNSDFFKIDDRTTDDLIESTIKLTRLINYYDDNNTIDGNWEDFFNSDIDILVTMLSKSRLKSVIRKFEVILSRLQDVRETEQAIPVWNEAFLFLASMIGMLQRYHIKLMLPENRNSRTTSLTSIANDLQSEFGKFITGHIEFSERFAGIVAINYEKLEIQPVNYVEANSRINIFEESEPASLQTELARSWFNNLFAAFRMKFSNLILAADYYLQHIQLQGNAYEPHLGLFVTFLHLYHYLQDEINKLTGRHLRYYYGDIIRMQYQEATPGKMYLLFQPVPTRQQVRLPAGVRILAEVPETKQVIEYRLQQDVSITQAQIKELKTGFISRRQQFSSNDDWNKQVEELRMYARSQPVLQPQHYKDQKNNYQPWALFGEEQSELPFSQRTMDDAELGLVIASPLLYAQDGKRTFRIRCYLTPASFTQFQNYISNFAEISGYSASVLTATLLNDSLLVQITTTNGWQPVKKYNLRLSSQPTEKYIELNFVLDVNDVPTDIYQPAVHGWNYTLKTPAIRLILNNNLFHHPFSFYKDFVLERISIQTSVTGSRQMQIRNSLGMVSPVDPFQLFGSSPVVGSYSDMTGTNIFNRYTKACSLHIEWFDLPGEPGGFETYFAGYDTGIRNNSYTVSFSALSDSRPVTPSNLRQSFSLFKTVRSDTSQLFLKNDTTLNNIDCNRLLFKNDMLLNKDKEQQPGSIKGGGIRIELTAPDDPFGHRTYPQILPGIIAHNTKKLRHKFNVPNPPYIPVAKSVTVDYTLEHTEIIRQGNRDEDTFTLLHIYPFGYKEVYPDSDTTELHFIPSIEQESNLLIGLQNAEPDSEISFLFELEETTYHHTAHVVEPVIWSYLQNNVWVIVRSDDILYDSTSHFSRSGIVTVRLNDNIATGNTILNPDLYWLKASSAGRETAASRVVAIFPQAGIAIRDISTTSSDNQLVLPPHSITGFKQKIPDITAMWQLFPTTGGSAKETTHSYNLRVSERLRHKDKPLTATDFAQMILEAFPEIQVVKCLRREALDNLILPGINMQIVVIPEKQKRYSAQDQPRVSLALLLQIKEFVNTKLSPFAKAEVGNAVYEEIKIVCSVKLNKNGLNSNDGYYINLFNSDIKKFIAPWLFTNNETVTIGGRIYMSDILNFVKSCPYISYASGFSVLHFYKLYNSISNTWEAASLDSSKDIQSYVEASRPDAVLISSSLHFITIINNPAYLPPVLSGIGDLAIGKELYLTGEASLPAAAAAKVLSPAEDEDNLFFHF